MTEKVVIGDATLYLGDCLEVLPTLPRVDAVVTDIPYEISQESNGLRNLDYGEWDWNGSTELALKAISMLREVPSVIVWCDWRQLSKVADALPGRSERPLTWVKPNPPVLNGQSLFLSSTEHGFYGKLPGAWFSGGCVKSYWICPPPMNREHPTQKPEWLMFACVQATAKPNSVVLDPFMGSGTTGVAAVQLGRKFIGIEIERKYFDVACERIDNKQRQVGLFTEKTREEAYEQHSIFA